MSSWTDDVDSEEESDDATKEVEESDEHDFSVTLTERVENENAGDIDELQYVNGIDDVDDEDVLRRAWLQLDGERRNIVENRLEDLGVDVPEDDDEDSSDESVEMGDEGESEEESETDDESSDGPGSDDDSGGWGGSSDDESEEAAEPSIESAEEIEEDEEEEDGESAENQSSSDSGQSDGPPVPESAISADELLDRDRRWKIMAWGPPKLFKTHFAYTMPEPIAYIDTEGKADDILSKFSDKTIQFWRPHEMEAKPDTKFRRVRKAAEEALEWLEWYRVNEGQTGTIVIDSVSDMWEWAQRHHKLENYPLKDPEDVDLSSNFQSSQESDWAVIKEYHNGEVRDSIVESPFHFYWTAKERVAFEETFDDDDNRQYYEPRGEPNNDYHVDTIIRARKDSEKGKVGDLVGSNFTDNVFVGLEKPTFPKVKKAVDKIQHAEGSENPKSRSQICDEIDAESIIDFDPQVYVQQ